MRTRGSGSQRFCGIESMERRLLLAAEGSLTSHASLSVTDPKTNHTAELSMVGPGTGTLSVGSNGYWRLLLSDTTRATTVRVNASDVVQIEQIADLQPLGVFNAPMVDWLAAAPNSTASTIDFTGGILHIMLHDSSAMDGRAHKLTIGLPDRPADTTVFSMHDMNDISIDTQMPISAFSAHSYAAHGNYHPAIQTASYFGTIAITSDVLGLATTGQAGSVSFSAAVPNLKGNKGIVSLSVGGNITHASFSTTAGSIGSVSVGGTMNDAQISTHDGAMLKATVGPMTNGSEIRADNGRLGSVLVHGNVDDSTIHATAIGSVGPVTVTGDVTNGSTIAAGNVGSLGLVVISGGLSNSTIRAYEGNIPSVVIGSSMTNGAQIVTNDGTIVKVTITNDLTSNSQIRVAGFGRVSSVSVGHNMDDAQVTTTYGDITQVRVGGNVDHTSAIQAGTGALTSLTIGGNLDNDSAVAAGNSAKGIGRVAIAGNAANGASIKATRAKIGTVVIGGGALGTAAGQHTDVEIAGDAGVASVTIAYDAAYTYISTAFGAIASVKIGGTMRQSQIGGSGAIRIGSVTVGALDASRISAGLSAATPTGQRSDFAAPGTISIIVVKGVGGPSGTQFMINSSAIGGWFIGKITFADHSTGSGIIEGHAGTVINAPVDALGQSLWKLIA